MDVVKRLRDQRYAHPLILGYSHDDESTEANHLHAILRQIRLQFENSAPKVALEIGPPSRLVTLKSWFRRDQEWRTTGTIDGKKIGWKLKWELKRTKKWVMKAQDLALAWELLSLGFEVISIENELAPAWERENRDHFRRLKKWVSMGNEWGEIYNPEFDSLGAVRRDISSLAVMDSQRPDLIVVGASHAMKFDLLLERAGKRTLYLPSSNYATWDDWLKYEQTGHDLYRQFAMPVGPLALSCCKAPRPSQKLPEC